MKSVELRTDFDVKLLSEVNELEGKSIFLRNEFIGGSSGRVEEEVVIELMALQCSRLEIGLQ